MPGTREKDLLYDHLCFSLGWIFSSGGQYHGELPEIHYCYAAGSGGDRRQQRTLSSTQEAYVVSMNVGAANADNEDANVVQVARNDGADTQAEENDIIFLSATAASLHHVAISYKPTLWSIQLSSACRALRLCVFVLPLPSLCKVECV